MRRVRQESFWDVLPSTLFFDCTPMPGWSWNMLPSHIFLQFIPEILGGFVVSCRLMFPGRNRGRLGVSNFPTVSRTCSRQQELPAGKKGRQWESEAERNYAALIYGNNGNNGCEPKCNGSQVHAMEENSNATVCTFSYLRVIHQGQIDNLLQMIEYRKI